MSGIERIAYERRRQVEREGWTPEHDDEHCFGELSGAACSYAEAASRQVGEDRPLAALRPNQLWRWSAEWWKPSEDPVRNLEKAGALIAAEIDRILRDRAQMDEIRARLAEGMTP